MPLELGSLKKSVEALASAIAVIEKAARSERTDQDTRDVIRAGVIQNFEITYELAWKLISRWLDVYVAPDTSRAAKPQLYRIAAECKLIDDVDTWMRYHQARNTTSHIHDKDKAEQVYTASCDFVHDAERLFDTLESRND